MHNLRAAGNQHVAMCSTLSNDFHVVHALLFMYKVLNNQTPSYIKNLIVHTWAP